jgi:alpha-D-ribose 1-methylphosphonate 5-triphosphate synthase subunit PhnL
MVESKPLYSSNYFSDDCILVFGRSGAGKSTALSALYYGKTYDVKKHNFMFKAQRGLSGTTQKFVVHQCPNIGL